MSANLLDFVPIWAHLMIVSAVIGFALLVGRYFGRKHYQRSKVSEKGPSGILVGSILSLLAFLLAFTFSMAASRFEERRESVLEEANSIGTAYLRADLLAEPLRSNAKHLLKQYAEIRATVASPGWAYEGLRELIGRSEKIQIELWDVTVSASEAAPSAITGLFVQAINEIIDVHAKRIMLGTRSTIPSAIWACLYFVAAIGLASAGFQSGGQKARNQLLLLAVVLTFALVLTLVTDLDHPGRGILMTDQSPMLDLAASLSEVQ
ncbi:bestrophin-like domain [Tateyamaria pelophila]|uniref:bestrophin-like domain n=1 Tax=Tateyamaria pelophila TaxID=328415 RepID=UPI001CBC653E|nr:DUF4239 domain-containing protein [Tateyamaria pelophila]